MTKKEKEILADIRNKIGPLYSYFQLKEEIGGGSYTPNQLKDLEVLLDKECPKAIENMKEIKKLLDLFE